jgi:hypothetical protein
MFMITVAFLEPNADEFASSHPLGPGGEHEEPGLLLDANLVLRAAIMLVL